jgi:hypothetical protein
MDDMKAVSLDAGKKWIDGPISNAARCASNFLRRMNGYDPFHPGRAGFLFCFQPALFHCSKSTHAYLIVCFSDALCNNLRMSDAAERIERAS